MSAWLEVLRFMILEKCMIAQWQGVQRSNSEGVEKYDSPGRGGVP